MQSRDRFGYLLTDERFFESLDHYQHDSTDFSDFVVNILPKNWKTARSGPWFSCLPPYGVAIQGWKIHISSTMYNATAILQSVAPVLIRCGAGFKFASDRRMLGLLNSKSWSRGGSGKFLTVYPTSVEQFQRILENLYNVLKAYEGPYILSDKRYRDSKVLYYRYGGIRALQKPNVEGDRIPVIISPDGELVPDIRRPYYVRPSWVSEVLEQDNVSDSDESGTLKKGRYRVEGALAFSNCGGVYHTWDNLTQSYVVIKEARPNVQWATRGGDAISLLRKERDILKAMEGSGVTPRLIDYFEDWEHQYLVEEWIQGNPLTDYMARVGLLLRTRRDFSAEDTFSNAFKTIFLSLAKAVQAVHDAGIVISDLSPRNILVPTSRDRVVLIDFDGAYQSGSSDTFYLYTPGYAPPGLKADVPPSVEGDLYSLGALMLAFLFPWNLLHNLKREARPDLLQYLAREVGLPNELKILIQNLLSEDPTQRPPVHAVIDTLKALSTWGAVPGCPTPFADLGGEISCNSIFNYIQTHADYSRVDRLYPSDPRVFTTNPISIAYGATGVVLASRLSGVELHTTATEWILARVNDWREALAPGFFVGSSGIACTLATLGSLDIACETLRDALDHPLLKDCNDLAFGRAGVGLAALHLFSVTQDTEFLDAAIEQGEIINTTGITDSSSTHWKYQNEIRLGLAHGASGVALFYLYLYLLTGREDYLGVGIRALRFDISQGVATSDGGLSWYKKVGSQGILYPYWYYGSAGVGSVVARYYAVTRSDDYRILLDHIYLDTNRLFTVFAGLFSGLAGLGSFMMDAFLATGEARFYESACKMVQQLNVFKIATANGLAFPGDGLTRITCDLGTGGAGVAMFISRVSNHSSDPLFLDVLIPHWRQPNSVLTHRDFTCCDKYGAVDYEARREQ